MTEFFTPEQTEAPFAAYEISLNSKKGLKFVFATYARTVQPESGLKQDFRFSNLGAARIRLQRREVNDGHRKTRRHFNSVAGPGRRRTDARICCRAENRHQPQETIVW